MKILGITGGIATGKSTVRQAFNDLGAPAISADALAAHLLDRGTPATTAVLADFPECVNWQGDGIDRAALSQLIFADPEARQRLESLTHPAIIAALKAQIEEWQSYSTARACAVEIPLLFETNLQYLVDKIIVVSCTEDKQIARLRLRQSGISESKARTMIATQWPLAEKIARANYVITTDGDRDDTRRQVQALWDTL